MSDNKVKRTKEDPFGNEEPGFDGWRNGPQNPTSENFPEISPPQTKPKRQRVRYPEGGMLL